jgi:pSer/pThr/pTyr-binding forkhead associated (FHA) protein
MPADPSPIGLHSSSAAELKERLEAERAGVAFLVYRDDADRQQIRPLHREGGDLTIGRYKAADVVLEWDSEVSGIHAQLSPVGDGWVLFDDGLSRNGTFVNGQRLRGRKLLKDGDAIRLGQTLLAFKAPQLEYVDTTRVSAKGPAAEDISPAQRRALVALCRPLKDTKGYGTPASNKQIAEELFVSVEAVKAHIRALFAIFDVEDLPQNQKRARLVRLAFESGLINERDL